MLKKLAVFTLACSFCIGVMIAPALADSYKIGAVFSVTGPASFLGDPEKKTAMMIAEQINAAGGIGGKKIELIVYDTEGDATKTNLAVKKLITSSPMWSQVPDQSCRGRYRSHSPRRVRGTTHHARKTVSHSSSFVMAVHSTRNKGKWRRTKPVRSQGYAHSSNRRPSGNLAGSLARVSQRRIR